MNKKQLISEVANTTKLPKAAVEKSVNTALQIIAENVTKGENVSLLGFGTFSLRDRQSRNGFNPQTKQAVVIPSKKVIRFKASNTLKIDGQE
ncbi:HU family DNA-binding protein [Parabacteroides pacaensis]|uniref:HU family DNA-binding protein n=1 Tax=Parabacteroides pacaensis TaxID=2086575 RepID=UPI000D100452|nr:HU family DNA-binding protein [Parabacteroides pacaensis]